MILTGVPDAPSICLDTDLNEPLSLLFADRLNPQDRGVGVSTDHRDRISRLSDMLLAFSYPRVNNDIDGESPTFHFLPMANATMVEPLRVR